MVIISSFYNEEYLLPWWCKHHKDMFKHGVLFNYFSTDNSEKIIKKICPHWEVRPTQNKDWDFPSNDRELMSAEREFKGYKTVLMTTEFLVGRPVLKKRPTCYAMEIRRVIDDSPLREPTYDEPLLGQKNTVYKEKKDWNKRRFFHNYPDGQYGVGRHNTSLPTEETDVVIYKYVFAPWTEEFIQRKLNMKKYVNPSNIKRRWGLHHMWNRKKLEAEYYKKLCTI